MSSSGFGEVDSGRIYYERDDDGPADVLIHGGVVWDRRMWDPQGAPAGGNDDRRA